MIDDLTKALHRQAKGLGFSRVGIVGPEGVGDGAEAASEFYRRWVRDGFHGVMEYLAWPDSIERRGDLTQTLASVRSVIVVTSEYGKAEGEFQASPDKGVIARYARGRDYHKVVKRRLQALARWLEEAASDDTSTADRDGVTSRAYVDTGPLLERDLARRAGMGWFGKNTMLIHPEQGSYFFLGLLITDVELTRSEPFEEDRCGTCQRCLDACPTKALLGRDANGAPVMDARRCISYLTIELQGPIPKDLRPAIGNRIYGCDICQEVCPWNQRFASEEGDPAYAARGPGELPVGVQPEGSDPEMVTAVDEEGRALHPGTDAPRLVDLMAMDDVAWDAFSRGSAMRRVGRAGFLRNVAVALGNWGAPEAVGALAAGLSDDEPLVRGHSAWALRRIGTEEALRVLEEGRGAERDAGVLEEMG